MCAFSKISKVLFFVATILTSFIGCTQRYVDSRGVVDEALARTRKYIEAERYSRVVHYLEPRINTFSGVVGVDTLVYFLAYAYLESRDYDKAQHQFRRLIDTHRASDLRPLAQYYLTQTYMRRLPDVDRDQHFTQIALRELFFFTELYPDHELIPKVRKDIQHCRDLLAERIYRAGLFYMSREEFSAARMYFSDIVRQYLDSRWVPFAYLKLVESFLHLKDIESAFEYFEKLRGVTIPDELVIDYRELLQRMSEIERPGVKRVEGLKRAESESKPEPEPEPEIGVSEEPAETSGVEVGADAAVEVEDKVDSDAEVQIDEQSEKGVEALTDAEIDTEIGTETETKIDVDADVKTGVDEKKD